MKKFISLLIVLVMSSLLIACESQPEIMYSGEKRSYTERLNSDGSVYRRWYYRYNPNGEISTSSCCIADGTCIQRNTYTYNEMDLVSTETIYKDGKKASYTEYTYSEDGNLSKEITYSPNENNQTTYNETFYYYDSDGNEIKSVTHDGSGDVSRIKHTNYDELKNKTSEQFYDSGENLLGEIIYTYEDSKLTATEYSGNQLTEFSREEYFYTGENVTKTIFYDAEGNRKYVDTAEYEGENCVHRMRVDENSTIVYTWNAYFDSFMTLIG